jgi:hypothetical protein
MGGGGNFPGKEQARNWISFAGMVRFGKQYSEEARARLTSDRLLMAWRYETRCGRLQAMVPWAWKPAGKTKDA